MLLLQGLVKSEITVQTIRNGKKWKKMVQYGIFRVIGEIARGFSRGFP